MALVPVSVVEYQNGRAFVKTVYRQAYKMEARNFALEKGTITDAQGKTVSAAEALKRLKVGATILVANEPVDPLYLRIIRPETLILIAPQGSQASIPVSPPPVFPGVPKG